MPARPELRWSLAAPLLVLAGLFGMHGLGDHTATHGGHPGPAMSAHTATASTGAMGALAHEAAALVPDPGAGLAGAATGLCVAVLLGGLLALARHLLALARRTPWVMPRQATAPVPVPRSRAPDPPSPALLSVYRC